MASERRAVRVRIAGRVQGVNFRAWTRDQADRLDLDGWVRNENDGSVAALIAGPSESVDAIIARLHQGPPAAAVASVTVEDADPGEVATGFVIRR
jgi:acylphosphatase